MPVVKSRCPVPPEQLPINEYQDMCDSWFYRWGTYEGWAYIKPLIILWTISWAVSGPIVAASFAPGKHPISFTLLASAGALGLPALVLAQLYIGWLHVGQRLYKASVPYEESGWYDGQIWAKPEDILNRDRLIMNYEVKPILRRARNTSSILLCLGVALIATWQIL